MRFLEKGTLLLVSLGKEIMLQSVSKSSSRRAMNIAIYTTKDLNQFQMNLLPRSDKQNKDYKNPDNDPRGVWKVGNLTVGPAVEKQVYEIVGPTGRKFLPPSGYCWRLQRRSLRRCVKITEFGLELMGIILLFQNYF